MTDLYIVPSADVSFGDIFRADFLFDAYLRADAVQLGSQDLPEKRGGGKAYSDRFAGGRAYVLAHGTPHHAILITDNCIVDTSLGQDRGGGRPKGRLLFAPISSALEEDLETRTFGRFPMPAEGQLSAGVAELRKCFMVDARDVVEYKNARVATLTPDFADELEVRWNAFAARRGPLVALRNADKMVELLARQRGDSRPTGADRRLGQHVAQVMADSWTLEGSDLEGVAEALNNDGDAAAAVLQLEEGLRRLSEQASTAAALLAQARTSAVPNEDDDADAAQPGS